MRKTPILNGALLASLLLTIASGAHSQEPTELNEIESSENGAPESTFKFGIGARSNVTLRSGFDGSSGDMLVTAAAIHPTLQIRVAPATQLSLGLGGSLHHYDFHNVRELDPVDGDPFNQIYRTAVSLGLTSRISEHWTFRAGGEVASSVESGASIEDGLVYSGSVAFSYSFSENFSLGVGLFVQTQLENDPLIVPLPFIQYRLDITEQLRLGVGLPDGLRLTYAALDSLEFSLSGGLSRSLAAQGSRLDGKGFAPNGVFRQTAIPVSIIANWTPQPRVTLSLETGAIVYNKLRIEDETGDKLSDARVSPSAYFSLNMRVAF